MLIKYNNASNGEMKISEHFKVKEFFCKCKECSETLIDSELILRLERMRALTGPLSITSGYRCQAYQDALRKAGFETATGVSQHTLGRAADVLNGVMLGAELEDCARKAGFEAVGVGRTWVHVDLRPGPKRWFYSKR